MSEPTERTQQPASLPTWAQNTTVRDITHAFPIIIYLDNPFDAMPTKRLEKPADRGVNILACGAGMQSTALALMSAENAIKGYPVHPLVPIYDAILFCDLGFEPVWVYSQVRFIRDACRRAGIPFYVLPCDLYHHYLERFGEKRVVSIPFWSIQANGKEGVMPRNCTIDFKIEQMQKFTRWIILRYKKYQPLFDVDKTNRHNIHLGFSYEEKHRCKKNKNEMFTNVFPLVDMKLTRADNYAYCRDVWGLETRASACNFCPFHKNHFFCELKRNHKEHYEGLLDFDHMLAVKGNNTLIHSSLFISRSRKRIYQLDEMDYDDAETFLYRGEKIWNGF